MSERKLGKAVCMMTSWVTEQNLFLKGTKLQPSNDENPTTNSLEYKKRVYGFDDADSRNNEYNHWHKNGGKTSLTKINEGGIIRQDDNENDDILRWLARARQIATPSSSPNSFLTTATQHKLGIYKDDGKLDGKLGDLVFAETTEFLRDIIPKSFGASVSEGTSSATDFRTPESQKHKATYTKGTISVVDHKKSLQFVDTHDNSFSENISKDELSRECRKNSSVYIVDQETQTTEECNKRQFQNEKEVSREKIYGRGLGATLCSLRFRGVLCINPVEWAGRHNDKKLFPHQNLAKEALFSGVGDKTEQALRLEVALRRTDEYGRVLTAKKAFRKLCYDFHGKGPSKKREQKRVNQYVDEIKSKKKATSKYTNQQLDKTLTLQRTLTRPYLVLRGNLSHRQNNLTNEIKSLE